MTPDDSTQRSDAGFTLTEVVIVTFLLSLLMPVLAFAFSAVIRLTPTAEDRADDARSLLNLTNWLSQDVSSTSEDGFYIAPVSDSCAESSLPAGSTSLLELHWSEGTESYVTNYRWVPSSAPSTMGQIFRYACQLGQPATQLRMTAELNSVTTGTFAPAPVEISPTPTKLADGSDGIKGIEFVVLILDEYGIRRELISLDATTTNVMTTLPGSDGRSAGTNTPPEAIDLPMTITPPATQIEEVPATDADGDRLFVTFPDPLPGTWNIIASGLTIEVTPDENAAPPPEGNPYRIRYVVTDRFGATAEAFLEVTIAAPSDNQPPTATAASITASRGEESVATLEFTDPDGGPLVLDVGPVPAGWLVDFSPSGNQVAVTPSATATGTTAIPYSVTDSEGATATSQIAVNVCTVSIVSVTPTEVGVTNKGHLTSEVTVEIDSNGACEPLVLGFLPNESAVESTVTFNTSNVATIPTVSAFSWVRPAQNTTRDVTLNIRQGANGSVEDSRVITTNRAQGNQ